MAHQGRSVPIRATNRPATWLRREIFLLILKGRREFSSSLSFPHSLLCDLVLHPHAFPDRTPALYPLLRQALGQRLTRHFCPHHTPGPWYYAIQIVATTSYCYPPPITITVRELMNELYLRLDATYC